MNFIRGKPGTALLVNFINTYLNCFIYMKMLHRSPMERVLHSYLVPRSATAGPHRSNAGTRHDIVHADSYVRGEDSPGALRGAVALVLSVH